MGSKFQKHQILWGKNRSRGELAAHAEPRKAEPHANNGMKEEMLLGLRDLVGMLRILRFPTFLNRCKRNKRINMENAAKATREAEAKVEAPKTTRASKATAAKAGKGEKQRRNNQNFQKKATLQDQFIQHQPNLIALKFLHESSMCCIMM